MINFRGVISDNITIYLNGSKYLMGLRKGFLRSRISFWEGDTKLIEFKIHSLGFTKSIKIVQQQLLSDEIKMKTKWFNNTWMYFGENTIHYSSNPLKKRFGKIYLNNKEIGRIQHEKVFASAGNLVYLFEFDENPELIYKLSLILVTGTQFHIY